MKKCLVLLAVLGGLSSSGHAQSVIFELSGRVFARDYFGGGGIVEKTIATTVGTNLSRGESATSGAGSSSTSIMVTGNTATFSVETLVATAFSADFNFFIYDAIAEATVDAYVLGAPGTPYDLTITGTGALLINDAGTGSSATEAGTLGAADPGFAFTWGSAGGTYSISGLSDSITLVHGGQTYSRVRPLARTSARSFFGITGTPGFAGFGSYHATQSVTLTVNNLASGSSAPEPGTVVLFVTGGLLWLVRRRSEPK
jgi:hypothetical protein